MFSRIANVSTLTRKSSILYRLVGTSSNANASAVATTQSGKEPRRYPHDAPERDFVNYPTFRLPEESGKVRMSMIPQEWFDAMYPKTGVTGPYILFWGGLASILSKEYFVYSADTSAQFALIIVLAAIVKYGGPKIKSMMTKAVDTANSEQLEEHLNKTKSIGEKITELASLETMTEANKILHAAKKENVELQLESEYRTRLQQIYNDVKKRLDYQVAVQSAFKRLEREQAINYIIGEANKSIGPNQEKEAFTAGLQHLKSLSTKYAGSI